MQHERKTVLLVGDDPEDALHVQKALGEAAGAAFDLEHCEGLSAGLERLAGGAIDVVLLDLFLPDSSGLDTLMNVRGEEPELPIVVVSGADDEELAAQAVREGAQDYVIKGEFDRGLLRRVVRHAIERQRLTTLLRQRTAELQASRTRFHNMIKENADGIVMVSKDGTVLWVNPAAETLFGRKARELLGEAFAFPLTAGETTEIEIVRSGEESAAAEMRVVETGQGEEKVYLASLRDITTRKRIAEALKESEERYSTLFQGAAEGILVADIESRKFRYANPAICGMLGYTEKQLRRMGVSDVHPAEALEHVIAEFEAQASGRKALATDIPCLRKDGTTCYADINTTSAVIDGDRCNVGFFRDVTGRRQLERQLRQAAKMEAVGRLAGGVAHDFNTILTGIIGYAELVRDELEEGSQQAEDMHEICRLADRAADLTRQLLSFGRRQHVEPAVVNINALVENTTKMLRRLAGEDVGLQLSLAPDLWNVRADVAQMEQVLVNLAVNARDAMPNGGKLTIETGNVELREDYARAHATVTPGPYVMLAVTDAGQGMDKETQKHIFEPFFTTKRRGEGTGLGLATVYGMVKQNGGNIWVYSEPGQGTTFKVYLPRVEREAETVQPETVSAAPARGQETILLVEDEKAVRDLAERVLRERGYSVLTAGTADEAEQAMEQAGQKVALLLTDVILPGRNGRELYEGLAKRYPSLTVLYTSGYTQNAIIHQGVLDHDTHFLPKPFTPDALARQVREVLDSRGHGRTA